MTGRAPNSLTYWQVNCPSIPSPTTATASPSCGLPSRVALRTVAPSTQKVASSKLTSSGIGQRASLSSLMTAYRACPALLVTRSPTRKRSTPSPVSTTTPVFEYPGVAGYSGIRRSSGWSHSFPW